MSENQNSSSGMKKTMITILGIALTISFIYLTFGWKSITVLVFVIFLMVFNDIEYEEPSTEDVVIFNIILIFGLYYLVINFKDDVYPILQEKINYIEGKIGLKFSCVNKINSNKFYSFNELNHIASCKEIFKYNNEISNNNFNIINDKYKIINIDNNINVFYYILYN
jgi:hypothetical protein